MAKLPRVTNKRFGSDIELDNIGQFGSAAAGEKTNTKDVDEIQALEAWRQGWTKATMSQNKYPTMQERNGLDYVMSYQIDYVLKEGIPEYDSQTEYSKGAVVKKIEEEGVILFESQIDENIGQDIDNSSAWRKLQLDKDVLRTNQITNCITEIPQRIKLELNNGVLILKAGSQVIVPNGFEADGTTPKFDYVTIESDVTYIEPGSVELTAFTFYNPTTNKTFRRSRSPQSGTSVPDGLNTVYYNTATNTCHDYSNGVQGSQVAFPICICTSNAEATNNIVSIDQAFDGFGYIGSTAWINKGIKFLSANGRNTDGTLKNIELETPKIMTRTNPLGANLGWWRLDSGNFVDMSNTRQNYLEQEEEPLGAIHTVWYKPSENITRIVLGTAGQWRKSYAIYAASSSSDSTGRITSFNPRETFRAVDYNDFNTLNNDFNTLNNNALLDSDKSEISGWGMPSSKYIDLTLEATETKYTAPANGWFTFSKATRGNQYIAMINETSGRVQVENRQYTSGGVCRISIPARKGDKVNVFYDASGDLNIFRFVYAEGDQ